MINGNKIRMVGLGRRFCDLLSGHEVETSERIALEPYQSLWLERV
jgi:hypothetical protein